MHAAPLLSGVGLGLGLALCPALSLAAPHSNAVDAAGAVGGFVASPIHKRCDFDSASSPSCWGDFDLNTNFYDTGPDTGVVREYWFDVVNSTMAPDGVERMVLSINGSVPGPTIIADWGDTIVVHVRNTLQNNGTSIHFHGIRQNHTTEMDGVASITQCPTAPEDTITYRFKATQYGSSWYHSHFQLQAWNGVFGGIVINGPASAAYDVDLGTLMLSDWFHQTADQLYARASTSGPPAAQNGLINGTNVFGDVGSRFQAVFEAGKRYRIRLVNGAMDTMFRFMIDSHNLTVIAADFVPINPYVKSSVNVGIGQRYDVVVTAGAGSGDHWLRAIPEATCSSSNDNTMNIRGVVRYDASSTADPTTSMWSYMGDCADEPMESLVPVVPLDVGMATRSDTFHVGLRVVDGWFKWTLNDNTFLSDWGAPTLMQTMEGNATYVPEQQIVELNSVNEWVYFIIENTGLYHPIHLHGHDVHVLAQGTGTYTSSTSLQLTNPPRRDVVMLPANGFLVLAFLTDNPGVWLMHCHIGWHTGQGFALQLVERASEIAANGTELADSCSKWSTYAEANAVEQDDSGI